MKALKKYLKKLKSNITALIEEKQESFTPDTFHTLRLEIKKLNALFNLVNFCSKGFKQKKTFKPFKLIFCQAGKVRELQLERVLLDQYFTSAYSMQYRNDLDKRLREELQNFFLIVSESFAEKLQKKYPKINAALSKTGKKMEHKYMDKERAEIEKLLRLRSLKIEKMHELRKIIKEYQFNQKSLNYNKKDKLLPKNNALPELLGEWHDYQTVIKHLQKAIDPEEINPKESAQLANVVATFTYKSQLLFSKINATVRNVPLNRK